MTKHLIPAFNSLLEEKMMGNLIHVSVKEGDVVLLPEYGVTNS